MQNLTSDSQIDQLGILMADEAAIHLRVEELKNRIKNMGEGRYEGDLFSATITLSQRTIVDYAMMADEMGITFPEYLVTKYSRTSASITCRVTARKS